MNQTVKPFGRWPSPLSAEQVAHQRVRYGQIQCSDAAVYWKQALPSGQNVIMQSAPTQKPEVVSDQDFNIQTQVHEYGGGDFLITQEALYFSNKEDAAWYQQTAQKAVAITPLADMAKTWRYADACNDDARQRLIAVREDHSQALVTNTLVAITLNAQDPVSIIAQGHDFYAAPRISPDGQWLAFITWDHPHLPWAQSSLWLAAIDADGALQTPQKIAGEVGEAITQPSWDAQGRLYFLSNKTGWGNLYCFDHASIVAVAPMAKECARPLWNLGLQTYCFVGEKIVLLASHQGEDALYVGTQGNFKRIAQPYTAIGDSVHAFQNGVVFFAGNALQAMQVIYYDLTTQQCQALSEAPKQLLAQDMIAPAQAMRFPTQDGQSAHAFYYAPQHADVIGPADQKPPLIVMIHGGPTAAAQNALDLKIQFWTTRGFAVMDVNYRGSTGFGLAYQNALKGAWGDIDVSDCVDAVRYLVKENKVDAKRLMIRGSSAGGFTALRALTYDGLFAAAGIYYGVTDLMALSKHTHKFEAHYNNFLIGPLPACASQYASRSPINQVVDIKAATVFFQGLQDKVVLPAQTENMVHALKAQGLPCDCLIFEQEGHGFRQAAHVAHALQAEYAFYCKILDL